MSLEVAKPKANTSPPIIAQRIEKAVKRRACRKASLHFIEAPHGTISPASVA